MLLFMLCVFSMPIQEDRVLYIPPRDEPAPIEKLAPFSIALQEGWAPRGPLQETVRNMKVTRDYRFVTTKESSPPAFRDPPPAEWHAGWLEVKFFLSDAEAKAVYDEYDDVGARPENLKMLALPNGFSGDMLYYSRGWRPDSASPNAYISARLRKGEDIVFFFARFYEPATLHEFIAVERMVRSFSPEELP